MNVNKVIYAGRLTRDPELRYTPKGTAVATVGMACTLKYKSGDEWKEDTTFVDIEFFGRSAETLGQSSRKGHRLYVEGRLKLDTWEDKNTHEKKSKLKIVGDSFQFIERREESQAAPPPAQKRTATKAAPASGDDDDGEPF
ncbi:MAG TPA: single-stranded DNA-binding protein [Methylomirabilota bacterium]|nr:single-stranded DNA-binding protein [Methylomirabilota bacterium]